MPNVTFHIDAERMPPDARLAELSGDCIELCTRVLQAEVRNVHVIYVAVRHGCGHPVFAEIRYRVESFRPPAVMDAFMEALDRAVVRRTGLTARIRCFGHAVPNLHARN
ncbi:MULTISPECIES: hypothetical protein [Burkholderia]|uniref:Uncharacterized protein n=1 Tax=Burkholderia cepacia TaxID=292 RepID=A0AA88Z9P6_BURCE|nr:MULTISPECIES: hypothetical protein [Burkholderia]AOI80656.1 hypothetical protein WS54_30330 [Burkholderia sp. NRF60-BP8]KGC06620.1 hypothetical protein DM43_4444 [Burkholderia cepacia]KVA10497.1 hypothetical protein WS54_17790 [Burkholderia sp. NRF60-BP8]KVD51163.1 hypothetical protein WS61_02745 [Burkholderia sp. ABCPW 11]KVH62720.1 hypothetical protein WS89_09830 [Burkholderia sp. MSMB1072]